MRAREGGDSSTGDPETVVRDWFTVHLCMDPETAAKTVGRFKHSPEDLAGWQSALAEAEDQKLKDPRAYVRSRAVRFKTAKEAGFGRSGSQWGRLAEEGKL